MATLVMQHDKGEKGIIDADFDADGKTDLIRWSDNPAENEMHLSNGDGTFRRVLPFGLAGVGLFRSDGCYSTRVADFNGDGIPDLLRYWQSGGWKNDFTVTCPADSTVLYIGDGNGGFTLKPISLNVLGPPAVGLTQVLSTFTMDPQGENNTGWIRGDTFYLLDVNRDGKLDIVTATLPYQVWTSSVSIAPCAAVLCTRVFTGNGQGAFSEISSNIGYQLLYTPPHSAYAQGPPDYDLGKPSHMVDFDGDGVADIVDIARSDGTTNGMLDPARIRGWRSRGDGNFDPITYPSNCEHPIDFNGDGSADCLFYGQQLFSSDASAKVERVADFAISPPGQQLVENNPVVGKPPIAGFVVADVDADGRGDILRWNDDPTKNSVFLSNGDGTFRESSTFNLKSANDVLQKSDTNTGFLIGDFTGRGRTEILRLKATPAAGDATSNQLYLRADTALPPDQLESVVSPTGSRTTLTWVPLSNSSSGSLGLRYRGDRATANAAVYPKVDVASPTYVIATSVTDSGVGTDVIATEYSYSGLKWAHDGRGSLGFREVRRQRPGANGDSLTIVEQHLQDHPYVGAVSQSETRYGALDSTSPPVLATSTNVYCDQTAAAGAENTATSTAPCVTTAKVKRPYLRKETRSGKDLSGSALPVVTTTNTFNATGDPTRIVAATVGSLVGSSQTFTTTTDLLYYGDTSADNWVIGKVTRSSVQSTVPANPGALTVTAGTAPNASSIAGTGPLGSGALSNITFGNVAVGYSSTLTATLTNTGIAAFSLTVPTTGSVTGTNFSFVSTTCTTTLIVGASCTVSVKFQPTSAVARSGNLSVVTGAGTLTATLSGTGLATISATPTTFALSATKGGPSDTQLVTFANSGTQSATLAMSGLTGVYSVSPSTCTAAAGASCAVTVTMVTTGTIGAQGTQTLTTMIGLTTVDTASVSGTLNGSSVAMTTNNASPLSATKGGTVDTGAVIFTNSGNQSATLRMTGLSGAYSVAPATCTAAANGGTCTVIVTMATSGAIGSQGTQTLTATDGTTGTATAPVSGTLFGSIVALLTNNASALSSSTGGANATGTVTFRNTGNQAASLTMSGLSGVFSVAPTPCTAAATNGTCSVTVTMTTGGPVGAQGTQTLTATGGTMGVVTAAVSGSLVLGSTTVSVTPASRTFNVNKCASASSSFTVTNTGVSPATISRTIVHTSGTGPGSFYANSSCGTLAAGATCTVSVTYEGNNVGGQANARLDITGSNFATDSSLLTGITSSTGNCT